MQRRLLLVLFGTLLIDMIGFGMVFPIIPILFTDPTSSSFLLGGYSPRLQFFMAGAITALWGLMQFIAAPILGELSDAYGRKKLLLFGVGILALSQLLFGFGINITSLALLFFARALAGIAAGNLGIAQASIADVTEPKDRAKNFGLIFTAVGVGLILGPLVSGWLVYASHNPALPFFVAGSLGILNVLFLGLFLPETHDQPSATHTFTLTKGVRNIGSAISDTGTRRIYLTSFLYLFGIAMYTSFFGVFLVHKFGFSEAQVGTAFSVVGFCVAFTQLVILRALAKRYSEQAILRYTMILVSASVGFSAFLNAPLFLAFIPVVAVPHALSQSNIPALISRSVMADKQGAALGINASLLALANGLAPIVMGIGSGLLGVYMPFLTAALFILIAWYVLFLPMGYLQNRERKIFE